MTSTDVTGTLRDLGQKLKEDFSSNKRVMSFATYLDLVATKPREQLRSSPQYIKDCFDYFGVEEKTYPWGNGKRYKLFDCPWSNGRNKLSGQEHVQEQIYRAIGNFVREGAANKLILLHGPNGSAKSTIIRCIGRGLQHYSSTPEGAQYRFNWIFPSQKTTKSDIGFSKSESFEKGTPKESFANLPDDLVDAKLGDECRDHPVLLIPPKERKRLIASMLGNDPKDDFVLSDYIQYGRLSHRNRAIYEALLTNYHGDYLKVLRHVQIERFYIRQRYREGFVTVEPQLSVDAVERQITADRSISALPAALQSLALFEYGGQLVNANRGLIEYSDLLKRPLEAYKYLLTTVEQATVSLQNATLYLDICFLGTSNEIHLSAFKEIAEWQSFRGRLNLVKVPYLLDSGQEEIIYDEKLKEAANDRHVAPHTSYIAALWAVMTRMHKPNPDRYQSIISDVVSAMTPLQKADLYRDGTVPKGLSPTQQKTLKGELGELWKESTLKANYEGRIGASPREMQSVLFNAAHSEKYSYVSPFAVLSEIEDLCQHVSVYDFLRQEANGGFHDHVGSIEAVRGRLLDLSDSEFRVSLGLVDEKEYEKLWVQYMTHVLNWTKKEQIKNQTTGKYEQPDESMMKSVEKRIAIDKETDVFRHDLISKIGRWSLDHKGEKPEYKSIFKEHYEKLRSSYYAEQTVQLKGGLLTLQKFLSDETKGLSADDIQSSKNALDMLVNTFSYSMDSARDMLSVLLKERF